MVHLEKKGIPVYIAVPYLSNRYLLFKVNKVIRYCFLKIMIIKYTVNFVGKNEKLNTLWFFFLLEKSEKLFKIFSHFPTQIAVFLL